MVFVRAKDLGLSGIESPKNVDENSELLQMLEEIRGKAAVITGLAVDLEDALKNSPAFPMVDFVSRLMFMQVMHKTYAGTGTICTGSAARIEGTVVNEVMKAKNRGKNSTLNIGHPAGIININVDAE